jgi:N-acetylglucosaminyl-diphospho-decaprenol L-rhamnosyltransferase
MNVSDHVSRIAVVVVTFNSENDVEGLVASLPEGLAGFDWQLVVADNASSDGTVKLVRDVAPAATVVEVGRNAGYAAGINAGVAAAAPHDAVLILNADVRLTPGCVAGLVEALRDPRVGIAVPRLVDGHGDLILTMRREPTVLRAWGDALIGAERVGRYPRLGEVVTDPALYERDTDSDWAEGSTQLVGAECFRRVGRWDESFFLYSEETDFALRARDAGLVVRYVAGSTAVHLEGSSREAPLLWRLLTINRVRLFSRRNSPLRTVAYWAALVARELSRAVLGQRVSQAAVRALLDPRTLRERPGPQVVVPAR